jgi:acetyl-CoA carboxylase biotin carboxylase subunit
LLAKLIVWGSDRDEAIDRLHRALSETMISGVNTTVDFYKLLIRDAAFANGQVHTGLVGEFISRSRENSVLAPAE